MFGVYFNRQGWKKGYFIFIVLNEKERLKNKVLKVDVVIVMGM